MESPAPPPPTQAAQHSCRRYLWVFLFNHDPNEEFPFSSVPIDQFDGTDFPHGLIKGHLGLEDRIKPRELYRGVKHCIFAKVEEGRGYNYLII